MRPNKKIFFLVVLMLSLFTKSCIAEASSVPIKISVPSLDENYPKLLEEAQKWEKDAYLSSVTINFSPDRSFSISAGFYSPSQANKSIGIYVLQDGTITTKVFLHEYPIYPHKPITNDDWSIDSQEALNYILNKDLRRKINSNNCFCSSIDLERFLPLDEQPLVWAVIVSDCDNYHHLVYVDPNTGELLELSRDRKPTQIPSETP